MATATAVEIRSIADTVQIAQGVQMPRLGIGTSRALGRQARGEVLSALRLGYRSIDTAAAYHNEEDIGRAIRASGVPREDIFITTKVFNGDQGYKRTLSAFEASRERLGVDYVDLYLIHWPHPGLTAETWLALEHIRGEGLSSAIGVSNFEREASPSCSRRRPFCRRSTRSSSTRSCSAGTWSRTVTSWASPSRRGSPSCAAASSACPRS